MAAAILPGRYQHPERIGLGGMGEIYRAADSTLGRTVAIKVLSEQYAGDDSVRERFTREALAAARLSGALTFAAIRSRCQTWLLYEDFKGSADFELAASRALSCASSHEIHAGVSGGTNTGSKTPPFLNHSYAAGPTYPPLANDGFLT